MSKLVELVDALIAQNAKKNQSQQDKEARQQVEKESKEFAALKKIEEALVNFGCDRDRIRIVPKMQFEAIHLEFTIYGVTFKFYAPEENKDVDVAYFTYKYEFNSNYVPDALRNTSWEEVQKMMVVVLACQKTSYEQMQNAIAQLPQVRAEFVAAIAKEKAKLPQWKEGASITLYKWQWVSGYGEDGIEYSLGWSHSSQVDERGFIELQPTFGYCDKSLVKKRLILHYAIPSVDEITFNSFEELPESLKCKKHISVTGFQHIDAYEETISSEGVVYDRINCLAKSKDGCFGVAVEYPVEWVARMLK